MARYEIHWRGGFWRTDDKEHAISQAKSWSNFDAIALAVWDTKADQPIWPCYSNPKDYFNATR